MGPSDLIEHFSNRFAHFNKDLSGKAITGCYVYPEGLRTWDFAAVVKSELSEEESAKSCWDGRVRVTCRLN